MQQFIHNEPLTAGQEVEYLRNYIRQHKNYYEGLARIELYTEIDTCNYLIEHDLVTPLIDDAFRFGIFYMNDPYIIFNLVLSEHCFTLAIHYKFDNSIRDERTKATFLKLRHKLEQEHAGRFILFREYHHNTYLVILQLKLGV